jgi:transposase
LRSSDPPKFKARRYEKKLDRFREKIHDMLKQGYIEMRIYEELLGMGYEGSLSSVHKYLHGCRQEEVVRKLSTTRVETSPGQQMQYDWKEWKLPVGDRLVKIYLHEVVLSYSRRKHYSFSLTIGSQDVIRALESALFFFGGSARELLIDNAKQMVLSHRSNGVVSYNEEFLRFCGLYGIEPMACTPYRARTKGKTERPFYYLQEHLLRGLVVESLEVFEERLKAFTEAYNQRVHSSLGESPEDRFLREREYLKPISPVDPTVLYDRERRTVSNDGYIRYRGDITLCRCGCVCRRYGWRGSLVEGFGFMIRRARSFRSRRFIFLKRGRGQRIRSMRRSKRVIRTSGGPFGRLWWDDSKICLGRRANALSWGFEKESRAIFTGIYRRF